MVTHGSSTVKFQFTFLSLHFHRASTLTAQLMILLFNNMLVLRVNQRKTEKNYMDINVME